MTVSLEKPRFVQAFNDKEPGAEQPQPLLFDQYILPWAKGLPAGTIIDLAAGNCTEAKLLTAKGLECLAIDASAIRLQEGGFPNTRIGTVDKIYAPDNSASGILLKDTLVFLSPETRQAMLEETLRVLEPGGSMLIVSQLGTRTRYQLIPKGSQFPIKDFPEDGDHWEIQLQRYRDVGDQVIGIEFPSNPDVVEQQARAVGLEYTTVLAYNFDDPIARENRWITRPGFIAQLRKPSLSRPR
jgi:hypothetical protein